MQVTRENPIRKLLDRYQEALSHARELDSPPNSHSLKTRGTPTERTAAWRAVTAASADLSAAVDALTAPTATQAGVPDAKPFCWWRVVQDSPDGGHYTEFYEENERPRGESWKPLYEAAPAPPAAKAVEDYASRLLRIIDEATAKRGGQLWHDERQKHGNGRPNIDANNWASERNYVQSAEIDAIRAALGQSQEGGA